MGFLKQWGIFLTAFFLVSGAPAVGSESGLKRHPAAQKSDQKSTKAKKKAKVLKKKAASKKAKAKAARKAPKRAKVAKAAPAKQQQIQRRARSEAAPAKSHAPSDLETKDLPEVPHELKDDLPPPAKVEPEDE